MVHLCWQKELYHLKRFWTLKICLFSLSGLSQDEEHTFAFTGYAKACSNASLKIPLSIGHFNLLNIFLSFDIFLTSPIFIHRQNNGFPLPKVGRFDNFLKIFFTDGQDCSDLVNVNVCQNFTKWCSCYSEIDCQNEAVYVCKMCSPVDQGEKTASL